MADVYRIQAVINLGGNLAPELAKIMKNIDQADKGAKNVGKAVSGWASPIDRAAASMGKFAREVANARKGLGTVDREVAKMRSSMAGLKAPASGMDREMTKWATAIGRPLAEMRTMRKETQGVGSAARGVSRSIDSWAGRISKATSAMQRMQRVASNTHLPNLPNASGTLGGRGVGTGGHAPARRGQKGHGSRHGSHAAQHEGSAIAGMIGIGGGVHTIAEVAETGIEMRHIELGMRQTGASPEQIEHAKQTAYGESKKYGNVSPLEIFEHINDLRGILGDMDKAIHEAPSLMPEFSALKAKAGNHGAKSAVNEIYTAVKSAETANEITAEGVQKHVNSLTRLAFWYGDKLNPSNYFTAQKNGGQMLNLTSDRFRYGPFAALTQEIGQRAGTQFATFAAKGVAGLRMLGSGLTEAYKYGLLQEPTVTWNKKHTMVQPGAQFSDVGLDGKSYDRAKDSDLWLYNNIIPKLKKGGVDVDNNAELLRALGKIFTDKNAYGYLFEIAAQKSKIEKDYAGFEKTSGDFTAYRKDDPYAALQGVKAQSSAVAAAVSEPAIPNLVENINALNKALGNAAKTLQDHPVAAQSIFAGGASAAAGVGAAGMAGLARMAWPMMMNPIGLTIGAATLIITGSLLFPWDAIKQSLFGIEPGKGVGRDAHLDSMRRTAALNQVIGPRDFSRNRFGVLGDADATAIGGKVMPTLPTAPTPSLWERFGSYGRGGMKRAPAAPSVFDTVPSLPGGDAWKSSVEAGGAPGGGGAAAAIKQAGDAIGQAGQTAAPSITKAGEAAASAVGGLNSTADGASKAGGALAGLVAKISALGSISLPGGGATAKGPAASPGAGAGGGAAPAGGGGAAPGKTSSVIYRGGAAPIHVATTMTLDQRVLGRSVSRHIVQQADTRNGTGRFDSTSAKTPVGFSEPITA